MNIRNMYLAFFIPIDIPDLLYTRASVLLARQNFGKGTALLSSVQIGLTFSAIFNTKSAQKDAFCHKPMLVKFIYL